MTLKASSFPTVRPTLDLNFAQSKTLDPRVTFSRSSSGTYFDGAGVLQSAAINVPRFDHDPSTGESLGLLVEEARTNLRNYSSAPDASKDYRIYGSPTHNATVAPDGTSSAVLITGGGVTFQGFDNYSNDYGNSQNVTQTYSLYVKNLNATSIRVGLSSGEKYTFTFATETGVATAAQGGFQKLSNGWYRIWLTATKANQFSYQQVYIDDGSTTSASVYFWGVQLEAGSFPTSYIPTPATWTGRASTATFFNSSGVLQTAASGVARSAAFFPDNNGAMRPAGLLLEAAATNAIFPSSPSSAGWAPSALSNFGATTGITFNQANSLTGGNTAASFNSGSSQLNYQLGTVSSGSCLSFYIRNVSSSVTLSIVLPSVGGGTITITPAATISLSSSGWLTNGRIANAGNGWYRVSAVINGSSGNSQMGFSGGNAGVLVDLFQLETGSSPTSYIATTTATVTRAADTSTSATVTRSADVAQITGTNFSSWYTNTAGGGTVFTRYRNPTTGGTSPGHIWSFDGGGVRWLANWGPFQVYDGSVAIGAMPSNVLTSPTSDVAVLESINGIASTSIARNGVLTTGSSGAVRISGLNQLSLGITSNIGTYLNGTISRFTYWPTRLSGATLQAITR